MGPEKLSYLPFFNIYSPAVKIMLGVEDMRSIKAKLKTLGVTIHGHGKDSFIISEEVVEAIRAIDNARSYSSIYISKSPYADL